MVRKGEVGDRLSGIGGNINTLSVVSSCRLCQFSCCVRVNVAKTSTEEVS